VTQSLETQYGIRHADGQIDRNGKSTSHSAHYACMLMRDKKD